MEVVFQSFGKEEKITIDGKEVRMKPGVITVVPDELGKALLAKSGGGGRYLTVNAYKKWEKDARRKKYKFFDPPPKPKKEEVKE